MSKMHQTLNATLMSRQEMMSQFMDPRRDIDDECGFPPLNSLPDVATYRALYDREAIAARVVELYPLESWQVTPEVYEDEDSENITEFEQAWNDLAKTMTSGGGQSWFNDEEGSPIWEYLIRADILSGIGHFGVILLGVDDGRALHEPIDGVMSLDPPDDQRKYLRNGWVMNRSVPEGEPLDERTMRQSTLVDNAGFNLHPTPKPGYQPNLPPKPAPPAEPPVPGRHDLSMQDAPAGQPVAAPKLPGSIGAIPPRAQPGSVDGSFGATPPQGKPGGPPRPGTVDPRSTTSQVNQPARGATIPPHGPLPEHTGEPHKDPGMPDGSTSPRMGQPGLSQPMETDKGPQPAGLSGTDAQYVGVQFGPPEYPSEKPSGEKRNLIFIRVFDEQLVQITQYEANVSNPRFGQPIMYRITLNDPREQHSGVGLPLATVMVHWSRVIHIADQRRSSEIFGTPRMRQVLNNILSLRKVYGGDGESYWRNCVMKLFFETHPQLGGDVEIDNAGMQDMMENMMNGLQQWATLRGMSAKPVAPTMVDPTAHINIQIEAICIKLGCPKRVFMGSERGELASAQDDSAWNDRLRHRQQFYNTPRIIVPFIDRLIQIGVLPEPKVQNQTGIGGDEQDKGGVVGPDGEEHPFILKPPPAPAPGAGGAGAKPPLAGGAKPPGAPGGAPGGPPMGAPKPPGGAGAPSSAMGAPKPSPFGGAGGAPKPPGQSFNPLTNRMTLRITRSGLVINADTGQPVTEDQLKQVPPQDVTLEAEAGYRIKWPDLDSLGDKDKAAILLQRTQAFGAYIQGGLEAMISPHDWLTREAKYEAEEATEILQAVEDTSEAKDQQTMEQQQQQMDQADVQLQQDLAHQDAITKQGMDHQEEAIGRGIAPDPTDPKQMMPHAIGASGAASGAAGQAAGSIHGAAHAAAGLPPGVAGPPGAAGAAGAPPEAAGKPGAGGAGLGAAKPGAPALGQPHFAAPPPAPPPGFGSQPVGAAPPAAAPPGKQPKAFNPLTNVAGENWHDDEVIFNLFCATGIGGGVDPTCGKEDGSFGTGTKEDPFRCGADIKLAAKLLAKGKYIQLSQPDQVATLTDRLDHMIAKAEKSGEERPKIDLCKVSVPGTNLFCQETKGVPRIQMPQMRGQAEPGSEAAKKKPNAAGKVDIGAEFIQSLRDKGIKVDQEEIRASHLRASQNEIDGARVIDLKRQVEHEGKNLRERPIFVTRDNYILDGHHHWAALTVVGAGKDKDYKVPVYKLNMDIGRGIDEANAFAKKMGLKSKSVPKAD